MIFVTHRGQGNSKNDERFGLLVEQFATLELMFEWLDGYYGKTGNYPPAFSVYKADCLFDANGSDAKRSDGRNLAR